MASTQFNDQIEARKKCSDDELLAEIVGDYFESMQLMGSSGTGSDEQAFSRFVRPALAKRICSQKHVFMAPGIDVTVAVCASLIPFHPTHIAAAIAVYACRLGLDKLCPDAG